MHTVKKFASYGTETFITMYKTVTGPYQKPE